MSSTSENETEILLGNRHLLAIFFVLAVLLGIAFTGGYMVGRNGSDKRPATLTASGADTADSKATSGETHIVPPAGDSGGDATPAASTEPQQQARVVQPTPPPPQMDVVPVPVASAEEKPAKQPKPLVAEPVHTKANDHFVPQSGQTFLQVAAVSHTEANALADVLSHKGFHAHAVAKPGAGDVYRVLIGPIRDASELSNTRDSLRNAGFTTIFPQKY